MTAWHLNENGFETSAVDYPTLGFFSFSGITITIDGRFIYGGTNILE